VFTDGADGADGVFTDGCALCGDTKPEDSLAEAPATRHSQARAVKAMTLNNEADDRIDLWLFLPIPSILT
jgi:hypothetical protein